MKIKSILMILFFLAGSIYLQGQPPYDVAVAHDGKEEADVPQQAPCATFVDFKQECNDQGEVVVTFSIKNNTNVNVSNVWVYLDDLTYVASLGGILPPGGTSSTITYIVPTGETQVCFNVRLLNLKGEPCCYARQCFNIEECPCAEIGKIGINCIDGSSDTYQFCIGVVNPAYSNNVIDVVMLSSVYPDLCINGIPAPAPIVISPIAPGGNAIICVTLSGCNSSIPNGEDITITPHFLDSTDPSYCCDLDPITVTTPCCIVDDCSQFTFNRNQSSQATPNHNEQIVSGVTATINFSFHSQGVPDRLLVNINGGPNVIDTGNWSTWGSNTCPQAAQGIFMGSINVVPCDVVTITVIGNSCNVGSTGWTLGVTCNSVASPLPADMLAASAAIEATTTDGGVRERTATSNTLNIFPNPVREILTIKNSDSEVKFETINVLDASGKIIMTDNMSGNSEIRVDVSSLSRGIYFIDAMDSTGNKVTERFVKVN